MKGQKTIKIGLCKHYTTTGAPKYKPKCERGWFASPKCHEKNDECAGYEPSETSIRHIAEVTQKKLL